MKIKIAKRLLFLCLSGVLVLYAIPCQAQESRVIQAEKDIILAEETVTDKVQSSGTQLEKTVKESNDLNAKEEIPSLEKTAEATSKTELKEESEFLDETNTEEVKVTELDLGDYISEMTIGEKQLLCVTILPQNATGTELTYQSSNKNVATINGMGRITAVKKGTTKITVSCGKVSATFDLTVKEAENTEIPVTELDLGDCPKEITVGTSQILSVGVIPADATETTFTYETNNPTVASVNALGRLTGNQTGTAEITVSCGNIKGKFQVTVVEDGSEEVKKVQDVEIGDYEEELEVDKTLNLSATVVPSDATDSTITYKSSDTGIATVNSSGEVKGIAPGQVVIYVTAGTITKQVPVTVKIGTTAIKVNSDYQVMKPNETFQLKAEVQPEGAAGSISYKSINPQVAEVSSAGVIRAKQTGNTAIVVSNGDLQVSVTVIVNEETVSETGKETVSKENKNTNQTFPDEVTVKEYPVISTEMLKYFYEKEKVLTIKGEGYTIYLDGKDIVNFENELKTKLSFQETENGFTFVVNDRKKLCGKIKINIEKKIGEEKYLYLYNNEKEKYQKLETEDITILNIDTAGKYLVTFKPIGGIHINLILVALGVVAILIGVGVYIGVKKRYWFW